MPNFLINYSPNFSTQARNNKSIKFIVLHYTGMRSENKAINRLTDVNSKVSCHYFIKKNGEIIRMVPEKYIAWHAGKSKWKKLNSLNKYSIGIEIQNQGHNFKYSKFKDKQIISTIKLCKYLQQKYKIKKNSILGHSDISYERKKDPGEKFPWDKFAKNKMIDFYFLNKRKIKTFRNAKVTIKERVLFYKNLKKIGYFVAKSENSKFLLNIAFQRRNRCRLVNGIIDKECLLISKKLSNN